VKEHQEEHEMKRKWYPYADKIFINAKIYTMDLSIEEIRNGNYDFTVIDNGYVAVKDGKIIGVGSGAPDKYFIGEKTETVDAEGNVIIPGMIDSHMHAMFAAMDLANVDLSSCTSVTDMISALAERDKTEPEGKWIKGANWNELTWENPEKPTRKDLDRISTTRPIFAKRSCCHVIVANSKALELAGVTKDTPDPDGGVIGRDENGEPNGLLYENSAMDLVEKVFPKMTEDELIQVIWRIGEHLNSVGLTTVIDCNMTFDCMRAYLQALKKGKLTYRDYMMFYLDKAIGDVPYHLNRIYEMPCVTGFGNDMLQLNGIKVTLDGVPASGTAYMRRNYEHMPDTRGYTTISQDEISEVCRYAARYNWQVGIHTIGDAAMDTALTAFEEGKKERDNTGRRNYLIHALLPHDDMLPKMKKCNVAVTLQPTIFGYLGDEAILADDLAELNTPAGYYFDHGIICGGSSDYPVVDCNPFVGMAKAMSRICLDGKVHGGQYKIDARQALLMWTMNSAYIANQETNYVKSSNF
jgi:predicted amidohydrolase YtcJ